MAVAARGRPSGAKVKPWEDALRVAALREDEISPGQLKTKLAQMAEKTVEMALGGDLGAIQEVANRLDGKAKETKDVTIEHRSVLRVPAKATDTESWQADHAPEAMH